MQDNVRFKFRKEDIVLSMMDFFGFSIEFVFILLLFGFFYITIGGALRNKKEM